MKESSLVVVLIILHILLLTDLVVIAYTASHPEIFYPPDFSTKKESEALQRKHLVTFSQQTLNESHVIKPNETKIIKVRSSLLSKLEETLLRKYGSNLLYVKQAQKIVGGTDWLYGSGMTWNEWAGVIHIITIHFNVTSYVRITIYGWYGWEQKIYDHTFITKHETIILDENRQVQAPYNVNIAIENKGRNVISCKITVVSKDFFEYYLTENEKENKKYLGT